MNDESAVIKKWDEYEWISVYLRNVCLDVGTRKIFREISEPLNKGRGIWQRGGAAVVFAPWKMGSSLQQASHTRHWCLCSALFFYLFIWFGSMEKEWWLTNIYIVLLIWKNIKSSTILLQILDMTSGL